MFNVIYFWHCRRHRAEAGLEQLPPSHVEVTLGGVGLEMGISDASAIAVKSSSNEVPSTNKREAILTLEEEEYLEKFRHKLLAGIPAIRHSIVGRGHPSLRTEKSIFERWQGPTRRAEEIELSSTDGGVILRLSPVNVEPGRRGDERLRREKASVADASAAAAARGEGGWVGGGRGEWTGKRVIIIGVEGRPDLERRRATCVSFEGGKYRCTLGLRKKCVGCVCFQTNDRCVTQ